MTFRAAPGLAVAGAVILVMMPGGPARATFDTSVAPPRAIRLVAPRGGAWVTRTVRLRAVTTGPAVAVLFEVSLDRGRTWAPVGIDRSRSHGWSVRWRTLGYNGPARLRASSVGVPPARDSVAVHVDNVRPHGRMRASPRLLSPNHDGRRDRLAIHLRTSEPTRGHVALVRKGRVYRNWNTRLPAHRDRRLIWRGGTRRARLVDGRYRLVAEVEDRAGLRTRFRSEITIDRTPPRLGKLKMRPEASSGARSVRLHYGAHDVNGPLHVVASVRDFLGPISAVRVQRRSGKGSVRLRTRYRDGGRLYPGGYETVLGVRDRAGNLATERAGWHVHRAMKAEVYTHLDGVGRRVALTFDDCHIEAAWKSILDTLERWHERVTFFCPGQMLNRFPDLARRTVRAGHAVGSHGWDHEVLSGMSYDNVRWRLLADRRTWLKYGATSAPYFRPPYGSYDSTTIAAAGATSHPRIVTWDVDSGDTAGASGSTLVCNVVCSAHRGSIILMHTKDVTAAALPSILNGLERKHLEPVSLPELFRAAGYR